MSADFPEARKVSGWNDLPVSRPGTGETAGFHRRSNARAIAAGLTFRSLADTTAANLAWFDAQPEARRNAPLKAGLTAQREAEVLGAWKARSG